MNLLQSASEQQQNLFLDSVELVAKLFWKPDRSLAQTLWEEGFNDYFLALTRHLFSSGSQPIDMIQAIVSRFDTMDSLFSEMEIAYVRLFVNAPGGIAAPLYQSCYMDGSGKLMGEPAQVMQSLLIAEGIDTTANAGEPADHLAIELEYLHQLLLKGWQTGDTGPIHKAQTFVRSMLKPWFGQFTNRLASIDDSFLYLPAAQLMYALLERS